MPQASSRPRLSPEGPTASTCFFAALELCGEWNRSRSIKSLSESSQNREVGVKADALQAANPKWREAVVMLQATELALDRSAASVESLEPLRVSRDAREQPTAKSKRQGQADWPSRPLSGMIGSQPRCSHSA
jgi:hypothetical protein